MKLKLLLLFVNKKIGNSCMVYVLITISSEIKMMLTLN